MARLPKAYIKKWGISKTAWQKFRAKALSKKPKKTKKTKSRTSSTRKRVRTMVRRKKNSKKRKTKTSLAVAAGLIPLVLPPVIHVRAGNVEMAGNSFMQGLTGFDMSGKFDLKRLLMGVGPIVVGGLVSKYIGGRSGLNINQYMKGIPFVKI